jgi:hypothetical protein
VLFCCRTHDLAAAEIAKRWEIGQTIELVQFGRQSAAALPHNVTRATIMRTWGIAAGFVCILAFAGAGVIASSPPVDDPPAPDADMAHATATPAAEGAKFYESEVRPILEAHCYSCHGFSDNVESGFKMSSRASMLRGGVNGPAISLDKPEESALLRAINYVDLEMPPKGKLPKSQIDIITRWVKMGAPWAEVAAIPRTGSPPVDDAARNFWSFRKYERPEVPPVSDQAWVRTPIDAFVLAKLEANDLKPAPAASKTTRLRRLYYDLIGLPPSEEEVDAFLADQSPDAYEKVVDRLLASPQYGERWARHWLDLVRYAETDGYEFDRVKQDVWRYRDYVIRSLNDDKPYDQFLREQFAGDEFSPPTSDSIIATGFFKLGISDSGAPDKVQAAFDGMDDVIATTSQVVLGLTMNCARCHDHKIDPIPTADYYKLLAFFRGIQSGRGRNSMRALNNNNNNAQGQGQGQGFGRRGLGQGQGQGQGQGDGQAVAANQNPGDGQRGQGQGQFQGRGRRGRGRGGRGGGMPMGPINQEEIARYERAFNDLTRQLTAIEDALKPYLEGGEVDDFAVEEYRPGIIRAHVPQHVTPEIWDKYETVLGKRDELEKNRPESLARALSVSESGAIPAATYILLRGSPYAEGDPVEPGFPSVMTSEVPEIPIPPRGATTSGRRTVLAKWLTDPHNPLTARVMANRLWQYHFGRGIVRTSNDFGYGGTPPTHPELLNWLASELVDGGWRSKRLHKMIVMSSAYAMSSRPNDQALAKDPDNDLFWRFDLRRLAAEEIRDSILAVSGNLNPKMGGPSIYPHIVDEVKAGQSRPGEGWKESEPAEQNRRSIYAHVKRSLLMPLLQVYDSADTDASCPVRFSTTQPTQALSMLNSKFLNEQAAIFAHDVEETAGDDRVAQVTLALRRTTQRPPTGAEVERGVSLIETLQTTHGLSPEAALADFCLISLNLNEFLYLD